MPSTKGYERFQFAGYAKLTVIGLAIALVTYNALVHLAPVRALRRTSHRAAQRLAR